LIEAGAVKGLPRPGGGPIPLYAEALFRSLALRLIQCSLGNKESEGRAAPAEFILTWSLLSGTMTPTTPGIRNVLTY
jgi:hypothetical protein